VNLIATPHYRKLLACPDTIPPVRSELAVSAQDTIGTSSVYFETKYSVCFYSVVCDEPTTIKLSITNEAGCFRRHSNGSWSHG
jgi:hypothetical protein